MTPPRGCERTLKIYPFRIYWSWRREMSESFVLLGTFALQTMPAPEAMERARESSRQALSLDAKDCGSARCPGLGR